MVELTKKRFSDVLNSEGKGCNLEVVVANAEATPFKDAEFDRCYGNLCLQLVEDPVKMLKEVRRVLKPGSTAAFSVWGRPANSAFMTIIPSALNELNLNPTGLLIESNYL